MNNVTLKELKVIVERAVRPVRATMARKRKMREELLAHLVSIFDEEAEKLGDEQAALAEAKRRFGDPKELSRQLQESVPRWDRCRSILENMGCQPSESAWHLAGRHFLVTLMIYTAVLVVAMPILLAFVRWSGIEALVFPETVEGCLRFGGVMLVMVLLVVLFNAALSLILALLLNKFDSAFMDKRWGRKLLVGLCGFVFPFAICGLFAGAAVVSFSMARQATEEWRYKADWA